MDKQSTTYRSVLFVDAGVANAAALTAGVAEDVLVVKLVSWRDGVEQIATVLRQYQDLDSVQIVSHGAAGELQLGKTVLSAANLGAYQDALREWGAALSDSGDLLLYGCDVAAGDLGLSFIDGLALATSADVAASTDTTGSSALGANWDLERSTGSIEAASVLSAQAQQDYAATLALVNNGNNGTLTFNTNSNVTLLNATGLAAGAVAQVSNILNTGFDVYAQSSNGGAVTVVNANGNSIIGLPLTDDRLTVNGSLLSPVTYVDLRANSGVFDMVSMNLGTGSVIGNTLGNAIFTVYALDANYQPTGVGVSLTSLIINEYGLLNFAAMADFKGIYGVRILNPLGFEVGIDDITIANARVANTITSAAYNANTGVLNLTAVGIRAGDAIDPTKLTITGANGATYTLTSPVVSASSTTAASITLNAADKLAINGLLNNNGATSVDGTTFNIAAAANWDSNLSNGVDLTGNPITVSSVQLPTITSASYNAGTHVLTVTGSNLVGIIGANNDISVAKLGLKGEGGVTRMLSTTGNVEVTSATSFSVTLTGADIAAVEALLNKNGTTSAGGTVYALTALDDWNSAIGNTNTAVSAAMVVVNNTSNSAPTISGAAAGAVNDNATVKPFANVTVADVNGDNVSMTITFNGANGTLSGAGLSGSNGSYTLSAQSPAALTTALKALTFTPTSNQAAVGVGINTTFSLVATDANGAASATNTSTVITATSVNDAPVLGGASAGQTVAAGGTVRPFSSVTVSDPDVGATVIVTITPDSASKGAFTAASLADSGFTTTNGGVSYTLSAVAPSAAQAALQQLVYQSTSGLNATTTFTVLLNDGTVIASNNTTTVVSAAPSGTTALTVAFSADTGVSNSDLITKTAAQTISGTLSANLASGESVQVSLDNGASWSNASASIGSSNWTLAGQTLPNGSGTLQVRVTNAGGSGTPLSVSYTLDTTAPTNTGASVSFSNDTGVAGDLITKTAAQNISGTLTNALATDEHVEVSLNNGSTWVTASASSGSTGWSLNGQTLTGNGTLQVRVVDAAGNIGNATSNAYVLDTTAPTASLSSNVSVLRTGEVATITLTFSEAPDPASLTLSDFSAVGGTLSNLVATANPRVYTVDFSPNGGLSGLLGSVSLAANSYTDLAGNNGSGASSAAITVNTLGPSVVITSDKAAVKIGDTANITFTFSSPPSGFAANDIVVTGGTISGLSTTGNGVYTAVFTPGANVSAPASITVTGGSYTDGANPGGAGASPTLLVDTKAPTLAITSSAAAVKLGDTATITFTFSETPVDFTAGDVVVTNGTLSGFAVTANPLVYTATLTPNSGVASGAVSITVPAGSYTDVIGNSGSAAPSPSISIDTVAPTTTGASVSFSADTGISASDLITRTAAQNLSGTLSAALVSGETVQVSLDNGATWANATASVGSANWTLNGRTLTGSDTLQVRVNDAAGNHGAAFSTAYVLDQSAPSVLVSSDLGALKAGESATLTFSFSEAPSNFSAASLNVSGGSVSAVTATANPLVYTAVFTPTPNQLGVTATVQVKANGYIDAAGNNGQASLPVPIVINTTLPTLLISSSDNTLTVGESATLTFTFSTPPSKFDATDISYSNGTLSGFTATANPLVYTAVFTPSAGLASGSAGISVAAGSYTDAFGNAGGGASGPAISIDTLAPTVAITSNVSAVKVGETATITFTFSEAPSGFTAADVSTTGGTLSGLAATANPLVYTALFTPTAGIQGVNANFSIAAGAFTDAAGNTNAGAGPVTPQISIDTQAPTAVANSVVFSADSGSSANDLITNNVSQTISGTLGAALGQNEFVEISLNNGVSWTAATVNAGTAWSLSGQTLTASNTLQVRVSDNAGNHGPVFSANYVLDTAAPTVAITSNVSALKAGETATITFTFSEAVNGFDLSDISAGSGTLSNLVQTADPLVYTALYTPSAGVDGVSDSITVTAASYSDRAGNAGTGASSAAINVDTVAPSTTGASVAFSADSGAADLVTNVASQTISGTLSAGLQGGETVEVSLNNGATWLSASGSVGSSSWTLAGQTLSSGANQSVQVRVSDSAGNHGTPFSAAYTLDQSAPSLTISSSKTVLNSADTPLITFAFSEAPVGFSAASVNVSGGTLSGFTATANPLVYTAIFTPTAGQAAGVGAISVAAGAYTDLAANSGQSASMPAISYSTTAPGVAILSDISTLKAGDTANITFKFSTTPVDFVLGDVVVSGGTLSNFTATANPLIYTAVFSAAAGVANGTGNISIANGTFTDGAGNPGVGGAMSTINIDTLAPTLSITSSASSLNSSGTAVITFTFSETPAQFTLGDISATNGTISNLVQTGNPQVWTALFTPAANVAGASAVVSVAPGAYADLAGNPGAAGNSPGIAIDTLAPSLLNSQITFSSDTGDSSTDLITRTASQTIAGTLSGGALVNGDVVEVSFNNGSTWVNANITGSNTWALLNQTLSNGANTIQVRVSDSAGNHGAVSTTNYVLDTAAPTVSVSSDSSALRAGQSATITFTFSEAPSGFTLGDLTASGGTLSGFAATANPLVYTVLLTPTPGLNGNASVTLNNGLYTDVAGNPGAGGSVPSITVDTVPPTLAITSSSGALKAGDSATITFTFSDAPTAFTLGNVSATNGTLSNLVATANPLVYTASFTPAAATENVNAVVSVAGSAYTDAAGNIGSAVSSAPITIDTLAPTAKALSVSFSADHGFSGSDLITNVASQIISGTLDQPLGGSETVQVSLDNGVHWLNAVATSATSWSLTPQALSGSGTLQVRVLDSAGNTGPSFSTGYVLDLVAPTMTVTSSATTLKAGESATLTFTFSEKPDGFTVSDLVAVNGALSDFKVGASPLVYTVVLTPNAGLNGASAGVTLAPGMYTDIAGNAGPGASSPLISVDTSPPVLTISSSANNLKIGESATITFTFSEAPFGFAQGDIAVSGGTISGFGQTANPLVYTAQFTPTGGVAAGLASLQVAAGSFLDAAGNANLVSNLTQINYSTQAPGTTGASVSFSNDTGLPGDLVTSNPVQTVNGTLSTALTSGQSVEVSLDNGLSWSPATSPVAGNSDPAAWQLSGVLLTGSGTLLVRVTDTAGNHGPTWGAQYVLDATPPTVGISSNAGAVLKAGDVATLVFTFSEAPQGFVAGDLTVVGGSVSNLVASANPLVYTASFTPQAGFTGVASVTLPANSYTDAAGNGGLGGTVSIANVDATAPTLTISSSAATLKIGETAQITFTFSEAPVGFAVGDVAVSGGTLSNFGATANPLVYSATFTPTPNLSGVNASISVAPNLYSDSAGNGGLGGVAPAILVNTQAPLAGLNGTPSFSVDTGSSATDLITSVAAQTISGKLSVALVNGEKVQVSLDDGANWTDASVSGTDWTLAATLNGAGVLRVRVIDSVGNVGANSATPYALDTTAPTVTISSDVATANGVTPAIITFTFSKPPVNFTAGDVSVTGGTLGALSASPSDPKVWTATFTPNGGVASGNATISVGGAYTDLAGNNGTAASIPSLQIDTVAPSATAGGVSFSTDSGTAGDLITNVASQTLSGTLNVALAAGDVVQFSLNDGATWQNVAGTNIGDTSWSVNTTLPAGASALQVRVVDAAGNFSTAYRAPYILDVTPPTVTLSSNTGTVGQGGAATITLTLSDPAVLTQANIAVTGGTVTGFSGSGTSYTVVVTPPANSTTPITVNVGGGLFTDVAGNSSSAATPLTVAVNTNTPSNPNPGTPSTIDGVTVSTQTGTDARTGLATRTVSVPTVTSGRPEDATTTHPNLADIPIGVENSNLTVSVPLGVGFSASGPSTLISGTMAMTDLLGRIEDHTVAGQQTRAAMQAQAEAFLDSLGTTVELQQATLTMSAVAGVANAVTIINGEQMAASGGISGGNAQGGTLPPDGAAVALVIDARSLPTGIGLQLDDVEFAAIIGAANVQGGAGQNFIIGDGEAQRIWLTTGSDNDTVYGNGGNDIIGAAAGNDYLDGGDGEDVLVGGGGNDHLLGGAGNDVLQGGRSDSGQWQFFLKDGKVVAQHQVALAGAGVTETVTAAELDTDFALLKFIEGKAVWLENLSLLYHTAFDRVPDLPGLNFWTPNEVPLLQQARDMLTAPEAVDGIMKLSNHDYVAKLLENSLGVAPTEAALAPFVARLDAAAAGDLTARASVFVDIATTAEHRALWITDAGAPLGLTVNLQEQGWILGSGDDRLEGGAGSDRLIGGDGTDTVVYSGEAKAYGLMLSKEGEVLIAEPDGALDTIRQIELGEFAGATVDLRFTQASAAKLEELGMLYHLTLDRAGDITGFQQWLASGREGSALAAGFVDSAEFAQRYGTLDDAAFINLLYQNVTDHAADGATLARWDTYLDSHSRSDLVSLLAQDTTLIGVQYGAGNLSLIGSL